MKNRKLFLSLIIFLCLGSLSSVLYAAKPVSRRTGLYQARKGSAAKDNVSLAIDALYYYGDMEVQGFALKRPNGGNFGVNAALSYHQAVARQIKMRYSLAGGFLEGNNSKYEANTTTGVPRGFKSGLASAAVGVEWYPVDNYGFYLYAGVLMQYSYINYDFGAALGGVEHSFLPMIPLEAGYNFDVAPGWKIGVHLGFTQGLIDVDGFNLDAYPQAGKLGDSPANKFPDGYLQFGLTISYSWLEY